MPSFLAVLATLAQPDLGGHLGVDGVGRVRRRQRQGLVAEEAAGLVVVDLAGAGGLAGRAPRSRGSGRRPGAWKVVVGLDALLERGGQHERLPGRSRLAALGPRR